DGPSDVDDVGVHHYVLGLGTHDYRGERLVSHSGGWIGWGTLMSMLPARRLGVVVLTNRSPSPVTELLTLAVFDRMSGKDPIPWIDRFRSRKRRLQERRRGGRQAHDAGGMTGANPTRPLNGCWGGDEPPRRGRDRIGG